MVASSTTPSHLTHKANETPIATSAERSITTSAATSVPIAISTSVAMAIAKHIAIAKQIQQESQ